MYEYYTQSTFCQEQMGMKMPFWGTDSFLLLPLLLLTGLPLGTFDFLSRAANTGNCQDRHGNQGLLWTAYFRDQPGQNFEMSMILLATPLSFFPDRLISLF